MACDPLVEVILQKDNLKFSLISHFRRKTHTHIHIHYKLPKLVTGETTSIETIGTINVQ